MVRSLVVALALAAVGANLLSSCGPGAGRDDVAIQRLETALCEKRDACGCIEADVEQCGQWPITNLNVPELRRSELTFHPDCLEPWVEWLDDSACQTPTQPTFVELCPLYHGSVREGMPCEYQGVIETECERGTMCLGSVCRDPLEVTFGATGEPCELAWTRETFTFVPSRCDEGTQCRGGLCLPAPRVGEPCPDFDCAADAICDDGVCVARPPVGEPCIRRACQAGAFCDIDPAVGGPGLCRHLGRDGEPCFGHAQCHSGNCPAGFCVAPARPGDACSDRAPCGPDSFCFEEACVAVAEDEVRLGTSCWMLDSI